MTTEHLDPRLFLKMIWAPRPGQRLGPGDQGHCLVVKED